VDQRAQPEDAPLPIEADLHLVLDLPRVVGGHEALAAILDPLDGAAELHGGQGHEDVLGVELAAHAEAASHVHFGEAQRAEGQAEDGRENAAVDVDALGRSHEVELSALRIGGDGHEPARLQRGRGLPRIDEALADHQIGALERARRVSAVHGDHGHVVGFRPREEEGSTGGEGLGRRGAHGQRIVDHVDEREGILGHVAIVGHHQRHRLAHVPHHAPGDGGLEIALGAGRRAHPIRDDGVGGHVGRGEHRAHSRQLERPLGIDGDEAGMGVARAEDGGLEHAGHPHVGDEAARARGEPVAAQPMVGFADHRTMRSACPCARTLPTNLFIS
jgi:hypothetical protein